MSSTQSCPMLLCRMEQECTGAQPVQTWCPSLAGLVSLTRCALLGLPVPSFCAVQEPLISPSGHSARRGWCPCKSGGSAVIAKTALPVRVKLRPVCRTSAHPPHLQKAAAQSRRALVTLLLLYSMIVDIDIYINNHVFQTHNEEMTSSRLELYHLDAVQCFNVSMCKL